ncbi:hypothetical protein CP533_6830 [Ophiocordyceps camponoti-saundersi (nom. inval.)]|nr:hypothetical protein CP533_6830 [Ophiocordyceps camponoti-saundersi (nom. inval.)]
MAAREPTAHNARDYSAYTVGWICALPKEQTAATAMLHQIHPELPNPPNDFNIYTLGSIGAHNVVIACLPKGKIGTNAASTVATRLVNTYPSVKFGLMVGIGGGIPPKVRLGDVVVSTPVYEYPGVIQWDFGTAEKGGAFRRIGALNNPPSALLTALAKLETRHDMQGSRIPEYLDDLRKNWPALVPKYIRSDLLKDPEDVRFTWNAHLLELLLNIFWAILGFVHIIPPSDGKPKGKPSPESTSRGFQVHYGLIASGNQVIKDIKLRDTIDRNLGGNVLCVEMEAAGLMDNFPCIVVRGICDYADSRKNYEWQEHAAAVAAAFAKELLSVVPAQAVELMPAIELLHGIGRKVDHVSEIVDNLRSRQHDGEHQQILYWLTSTDYAAKQRDCLEERKLGTGRWLLDSDTFDDWIDTPGQTLFCTGMPGAGKTILTSTIIDHLQSLYIKDDDVGVAFVYFDYNYHEEQSLLDLASSLLKQLSQKRANFPDVVSSLYKEHNKTCSRPSLSQIKSVLQKVVAEFSRVFILVDALDECYTTTNTLSSFLDELGQLNAEFRINIFATSRPIPEVTKKFEVGNLRRCVKQEVHATEEDVRLYLQDDLQRLPDFIRGLPHHMQTIESEIARSVQGMFLLAKLHVDFLRYKTSVKTILDALKDLPRGSGAYNKAYDLAMKRIATQPKDHQTLANQALAWIVHARGSISPWALQHALSIEVGQTHFDEDALPDIGILVSVCAGLVVIDKESEVIRLVHYTTRQYFQETRKSWFPQAEARIAKSCITYLLLEDFMAGPCHDSEEYSERNTQYPLYLYAAQNWGFHARRAETLPEEVEPFLVPSSKLDAAFQGQMDLFESSERLASRSEYGQFLDRSHDFAPLHLIAIFGLFEVLNDLNCQESSIKSRDFLGKTPLYHAIHHGHERVVERLLEERIDSDITNALLMAMEEKNPSMVRHIVITYGDDIKLRCPFVWDVLKKAAGLGVVEIAECLLHYLGQAMTRTTSRKTIFPLLETEVGYLHDEVAFDSKRCRCRLAGGLLLKSAMWSEDMATTRLLLDRGAEFEIDHETFHIAAIGTDGSIIELLLDKGADVQSKDSYGRTALARTEKAENIMTLLDRGADIGSRDNRGLTPLHDRRTADAVHTLLERGAAACIESRESRGRTPLRWAVDYDRFHVAAVLLQRGGADIETKDDLGLTPLNVAIDGRHDSAIRFLLDQGADIEARDARGRTPLQRALENVYRSAIQLVWKGDASVQTRHTLMLRVASDEVSLNTIKILLERGAYLDERDEQNRALQWYLHMGADRSDTKLALEDLLPSRGLKPNLDDDTITKLRLWASRTASETPIAALLSGATIDFDSSDGLSRVILHWALDLKDHEPLAEFLIDEGVSLDWKRGTGHLIVTLRAFEREPRLARLILEKSLEIDSWTREQKNTMLYCAVRWGYSEVALSILSDGEVEGDYEDELGKTSMMWAAKNGLGAVVELISGRNEAAVNAKDQCGRSPYWYACVAGHVEIRKMLRSRGGTL